jgi:hypothetical protein
MLKESSKKTRKIEKGVKVPKYIQGVKGPKYVLATIPSLFILVRL